MWGPSIVGFGSTHYEGKSSSGEMIVVGFSPRKAALTIYGVYNDYGPPDPLFEQLGPHTTGKGCLYLKHLDTVDPAVLEQLVREAWEKRRADALTPRAARASPDVARPHASPPVLTRVSTHPHPPASPPRLDHRVEMTQIRGMAPQSPGSRLSTSRGAPARARLGSRCPGERAEAGDPHAYHPSSRGRRPRRSGGCPSRTGPSLCGDHRRRTPRSPGIPATRGRTSPTRRRRWAATRTRTPARGCPRATSRRRSAVSLGDSTPSRTCGGGRPRTERSSTRDASRAASRSASEPDAAAARSPDRALADQERDSHRPPTRSSF